jgi:hypothetical protein
MWLGSGTAIGFAVFSLARIAQMGNVDGQVGGIGALAQQIAWQKQG